MLNDRFDIAMNHKVWPRCWAGDKLDCAIINCGIKHILPGMNLAGQAHSGRRRRVKEQLEHLHALHDAYKMIFWWRHLQIRHAPSGQT